MKKMKHVDAITLWWVFTVIAIIILVVAQLAGVDVG